MRRSTENNSAVRIINLLLSLPQSCFPLTVAFLHREKVLLSPTGGRFVFRDGKQLFSVASPGAAPLEQRRRPRAEARHQPRAQRGPCLLRSCLLRSSLRWCAWRARGARAARGVEHGRRTDADSTRSDSGIALEKYNRSGIEKCPDVHEPEEVSGCLCFFAVCHVWSIFVSNDISGVDK